MHSGHTCGCTSQQTTNTSIHSIPDFGERVVVEIWKNGKKLLFFFKNSYVVVFFTAPKIRFYLLYVFLEPIYLNLKLLLLLVSSLYVRFMKKITAVCND